MDVSVIIPTYNRLWSLPKAINSCFESRLKIEVIVIDDGSTDGTWRWLCEQINIITIRQENLGKDWAVNRGFAAASGKYIRFLDSDDWLLPGSTDNLYQEAEKNGLDITCAGYLLFNEHEECIKKIKWTVCEDFIAQQLGECDSSHYSAYIFKRDFITDIPHRQEFGALDDRQFIIEAAIKQPQTGYITQPSLAHRIHQKEKLQNASGLRESVSNLARLQIYKKCFSILEANNMLTQRRKSAACNTLWHLAHWTSKTHFKDAHEIYNWVYQLNPGFKPTENLVLARLYKLFGFTFTEKLLKLKRVFSRL